MLETEIGRLIVAVEALTQAIKAQGQPEKVNAVIPVKKGKDKETTAVQQAAPAVEEQDPFAQEEINAEGVTLEQLTDVLKAHAKALGTKITIALIKKHGADAVTPKINTVPAANYLACFNEAEADLKKIKTQGK